MGRVGGHATDAPMAYMPQLDGLRCLAAASVLVCHFAPQEGAVLAALRWGEAGVQLFFVLSGFLITTILLRVDAAAAAAGQPVGRTLRRFYARRFLRILPPYYALVVVTALIGFAGTRDGILWHLTYTTNFYLASVGEWRANVFHYWTLAVEEQFYLVWPCVVLFAPRRWLGPICVGLMAIAAPYRLWAELAGHPETVVQVLPIANVDTLAAGSLLALLASAQRSTRHLDRLLLLGRRVGVPLMVGTVIARNLGVTPVIEGHLWRLSIVLVGPWVVFGAARGWSGVAGHFLELRPVVFLGKVSYGIYLYHVIVRVVVVDLLGRAGVGPLAPLPSFVLWTAATLAVSVVSWHLLEAPIARRRRRVAYVVAGPGGLGHSPSGREVDAGGTTGGSSTATGTPAAARVSAAGSGSRGT